MEATDRQISYIKSLAGAVQGESVGYLSQVRAVYMSQRQKRGGLTRSEASAIIDELTAMRDKKQAEEEEAAWQAEKAAAREAKRADAEAEAENFTGIMGRAMTAPMVAEHLGVTVATVRKWAREGRGPTAIFVDERTPIWDRTAVDAWKAKK